MDYDEPVKSNLFDKGFNIFGENNVLFAGNGVNAKKSTYYEAGVPSTFIQDGDIITRLNVIDGYLQSDGFVTGVSGWRIDSDGNVEFNDGVFRGTLSAASGALGAITIGTNAWHVDSSGNMWWGSSSTYAAATIKISSTGSINFTTGTFSGSLSAASGTLGTITSGTLTSTTINSTTGTTKLTMNPNNIYYYDGSAFTFWIAFSNDSALGDAGDFFLGSTSKYISWDNSAATLTVQGKFQTASSSRRVVIDPSSSNLVQLYSDSTQKASLGLGSSDDDFKMISVANDIEMKVASARSWGFFVNGTREIQMNGDGDIIPRSNNTNQVGTDATAWAEIVAYVFTDKCLWLDEEDDLAILNAIQPKKDKNGNIERDDNGKAKLDHYSLPDWIHNGKKLREEIKRKKPEIEAKIKEVESYIKNSKNKNILDLEKKKEMLQEELSNYDLTEEEIIDRTGRNMGHFIDLVAGAVRQLNRKVEILEEKLNK